jgi:hypothetical protein
LDRLFTRRLGLAVVLLALAALGGLVWRGRAPDPGAAPSAPSRAAWHAARVQPSERDSLAARIDRLRGELAGSARAAALVVLLAEWAEQQPASAVRAAAALADFEGRSDALHECLPHFLQADPEAARSWLLEAARTLPGETVQALAKDAAAFDPELGFAVAQQLYVRARPAAMRDVLAAWAARDPAAAAAASARLSKADGYLAAIEEVGRAWADRDPAAAFDWAAQLPESETRRAALLPLVGAWAERAPGAAAQALAELPTEAWRRRLVDDVAGRWARADPEAALGWIERLREPLEREAAATTLVMEVAPSAPARAADWAMRLGQGAASPIVDKVMATWLARDPAAALAWASDNARSDGREVLVASALERWQQQDPQAAESWRRGHPTMAK